MPANEIRLNCKVSEDMDPLLHSDLAIRSARTRTRRLVQLAYLGLLYERQSLGTVEISQPVKQSPVARPETVKAAEVIPLNSKQALAPPEDFGDDLNELFAEGGMNLRT